MSVVAYHWVLLPLISYFYYRVTKLILLYILVSLRPILNFLAQHRRPSVIQPAFLTNCLFFNSLTYILCIRQRQEEKLQGISDELLTVKYA